MSLKIEQKIHAELVHLCGGRQKNVKGTSQTTLGKMSNGTSSMKLSTLSEIFRANNLQTEIKITSDNGQTTTLKF